MEHIEQFRNAMLGQGLSSPGQIIPDGEIHRFHINGDKNGAKNGWYALSNSLYPAGAFGCWKRNVSVKWCPRDMDTLNDLEKQSYLEQFKEIKRLREAETKKRRAEARKEAKKIWEKAGNADPEHKYLKTKQVQPFGIRQARDGRLIIPLRDGQGTINSLQFIDSNGSKLFLPAGAIQAHYFSIGKPKNTILICEGFATGASLHQATGYAVAVAFNAGNLRHVAEEIKVKFPEIKIIICADNDQWTKGHVDNPGVTKATEAAETIGAALAIPNFKTLDNQPTDFNDLAIREGLETVRQQIEKAFQQVTIQEDTPSPVLLDPLDLPKLQADILPDSIGEMVEAVIAATETPRELAAMLALSVLGACCQKTFSIMPEEGYFEPLNIWTLAALEPGNRKSSVMKMMTSPLLEWEKDKAYQLEPEIKRIEAKRENQEARIRSLRASYAKAKDGDLLELEYEIQEMVDSMPAIPHVPQVWTQDITPEHLGTLMFENGEKAAILSSEGGIFEIMAGRYSGGIPNLDIFLQSHAGDPVRVDRGNRQAIYMQHPALTMGLSPQPAVLHGLSSKPGFRGRGLLARFLYVLPSSPIGFRKLSTQPVPEYVLRAYKDLIKALLEIKPYTDEQNNNSPYDLKLSKSAWQVWKEFSLNIEKEMREGERFEHMTDWASKLPGAAARIAGLFHCAEYAHNRPWEHEVKKDTMNKALAMAALLSEHAQAVFGLIGADPALGAARKVWSWIERGRLITFTARDCFDALKGTFKRMDKIKPAFDVLIERHYISKTEHKKGPGRPSLTFRVNPKLTEKWQ